jgi:SagB-type dehydrogenase family enzyme
MLRLLLCLLFLGCLGAFLILHANAKPDDGLREPTITDLPRPSLRGFLSLEETLAARRSVREFRDAPLTSAQIAQLLWAAQGITHGDGRRTAPSAGALYPLELYLARAGRLDHYDPARHRLVRRSDRDPRQDLFRASHSQEQVRDAPAVFVIAAVYARTESKYGKARAPRYVHMEAGHAAQNLLLQAVALGLAGVPVGAFEDDLVQRALALPGDQKPLYLIPVGRPR